MKTNVSCSTMKITNLKHRIPFSNKTIRLEKLYLGSGPIGESTWTDGTNVYFSWSASSCAILTKDGWDETYTMETDIHGKYVWTDGTNIYYSSGSKQYIFNNETRAWTEKTWNIDFSATRIWTDGTNIYYDFTHVLKDGAWEEITWTWPDDAESLTKTVENIWTDNENIYFSIQTYANGVTTPHSFVLDKAARTWERNSWNIGISGDYVWTDGFKTYYEYTESYVLNKKTKQWEEFSWEGSGIYYGVRSTYTDGMVLYDEESMILPLSAKTYINNAGTWTEVGSFGNGIIFSINDIKHYTEKDMLWQEWVDSDYNPNSCYICIENKIWDTQTSQYVCDSNGNYVDSAAKIVSDIEYTLGA